MKIFCFNIHRTLLLILAFGFMLQGCQKDLEDLEKYQPQDWLEGKIFSQIQAEDDLSNFILCLERTGYDTILNTSGSYTVFAPTDSAFNLFFQSHPEYSEVADIPLEELESIVEFQMVFDAWSMVQFRTLDFSGWIDPSNRLQEPRAYKHKTIFQPENRQFPVKLTRGKYSIAKAEDSNLTRLAYSSSSKYSPVFFTEFFNVHDLSRSDYEFYFDRAFEPEYMYFGGARFNEEIPAENGFVYKTDHVVTPMLNGLEILENGHEEHTFNEFLDLVNEFSEFNINIEATNNQAGADQGLNIDTLYNLEYPDLVFNISSELTGNTNNFRNTLREHHGLIVPDDQAFDVFLNEYIVSGWGDISLLPYEIKRVVVNNHMAQTPIFPSDFDKGFINGNGDVTRVNRGDVIFKTYGSNCSFIGLNNVIVPRAFQSIGRPMYLTRNYQVMLYAVDYTKILTTIKRPNVDYAFYLPGDFGIGLAGDSSLVKVIDNPDLNTYHFETFDRSEDKWSRINKNDLRKKILNQIATSTPSGLANKEFLKNLAGNYIVVDHVEGTVQGTSPTTYGYRGDSTITLEPDVYNEETDNGEVYDVETFFSFLTGANYYGVFLSKYIEFFDLLRKAGLYDPVYYNFPFMVDGESYTVFVPTAEALNDYGADTLSKAALEKLLRYHFVKGNMIFTDGKMADGSYPTTLEDESSTSFITTYSELTINSKPDLIEIIDKNGDVYLEIEEENGITNQMVTYDPNKESSSTWDYITTGVIHEIDKVLVPDSLLAK